MSCICWLPPGAETLCARKLHSRDLGRHMGVAWDGRQVSDFRSD
jgi:hypothetical protein